MNRPVYVAAFLLAASAVGVLGAEEPPRPAAPPPAPRRLSPADAGFWRELAPRPADLWGETAETFRGWNLAAVAATAGLAGGLAFLDADMQRPWRDGDRLFGADLCDIGDAVGHPGVQAGVMGLAYTLGQALGDERLAKTGKSMAETMLFTSLATLALKGIFNRERPDGDDHMSFPSWHASATFGNATVLAEYYGWKAAVPAYLVSAFVAWSRVEDNKHFVSDVVAGAAVGCIFGHAVSRYNLRVHPAVSVEPVLLDEGAGVQARARF